MSTALPWTILSRSAELGGTSRTSTALGHPLSAGADRRFLLSVQLPLSPLVVRWPSYVRSPYVPTPLPTLAPGIRPPTYLPRLRPPVLFPLRRSGFPGPSPGRASGADRAPTGLAGRAQRCNPAGFVIYVLDRDWSVLAVCQVASSKPCPSWL